MESIPEAVGWRRWFNTQNRLVSKEPGQTIWNTHSGDASLHRSRTLPEIVKLKIFRSLPQLSSQ